MIDAGALIKNISNKKVAEVLLKAANSDEIDGVAYYDENNELKILERQTGRSVLFKDSLIPKERRVTFYDQRHTLGSDITQKRDSNAVVTVSETLKKFELFQAIWRMREIDKGQTLSLLIPQKILPLIGQKEIVTADQVLEFVESNQKQQELFDNFRSRKLEIKSIVEEAIHDALMEAPDFNAKYKIFQKTKHLLMQKIDVTPFEAFGGIDKEENALKILEAHTQKWVGCLEELQAEKAIKNSFKYEQKIRALREVPLNEKYRVTENNTLDTQLEKQVEVQVKLTVATKPDEYRENIKPWTVWQWPSDLDIFKDDFLHLASMPLYQAGDILSEANNLKVASMKGVFDETFLVSNNFLPRNVKDSLEIKAEPFTWYAKPVYHLVVTEEAGKITTLMIDQNDLPFFREKLIQDQGDGDRKICIYDPTLGITLQGKKGFNEKALQANPEFIKHIIYAKFWNGMSKYTPEEVVYLTSWIEAQGATRMYEFFQEIVRNKDTSAKAFTHSPLALVFKRLLASEAEMQASIPQRASLKRVWPDEDPAPVKRAPEKPK